MRQQLQRHDVQDGAERTVVFGHAEAVPGAGDHDLADEARFHARLWRRELIVEAEQRLTTAAQHGVFGRYPCEAAIQSVHAQSPITGRTEHAALATLYRLLAAHCPSVGVLVAQAAAMVEAGEPAQALGVLQRLEPTDVASYQPYWVTRAHALAATGEAVSAQQALQRAIGLTEDPAVRGFLGRMEWRK